MFESLIATDGAPKVEVINRKHAFGFITIKVSIIITLKKYASKYDIDKMLIFNFLGF